MALITTVLRTSTAATTAATTAAKDQGTSASLHFTAASPAVTSPSGQYELKWEQRDSSLVLRDKWQPQVGRPAQSHQPAWRPVLVEVGAPIG